jgi:hypothetical protein
MRWLCLLLVTSAAAVSFAADIQVICEPGLRVYLDGTLQGIASAREDGVFVSNVKSGTHTLRVEKDGFTPQSYTVEVAGAPIEIKVGEFIPVKPMPQDQQTGTVELRQVAGRLRVTSAPQNCVVEIDGRTETKNAPLLVIEGLAAGEHPIAFSRPGYERISGLVTIRPGAEVSVRGDLIAGKVETLHEGQGSLRVLSTPEHCAVQILGMTREKASGRLNMSHLRAGEHRLVVSWKGLRLATDVTITNGIRTIVVVSFMKGEEPFRISYEPE